MKPLVVNEIFYSLQGEGHRAGTANVFVRFAGCNLACSLETHGFDCDTEFSGGRKMTLTEVLEEADVLVPLGPRGSKAVIFTGGEPLLQVTPEVVRAFKDSGYYVAVETNGTIEAPPEIDYVAVSPKVAEHAIRVGRADEVRYVRSTGQALPRPSGPWVATAHKFVSPAWGPHGLDKDALVWCVRLCLENPEWRLSVQQHKVWKVR